MTLRLSDFDYDLPPDRIAQHPSEQRDHARLLTWSDGTISHRQVFDLPKILQPGDLLVLNRTRVIPARLSGRKSTGGVIEVLLVHPLDDDAHTWRCMIRGKVSTGTTIIVADHAAEIIAIHEDGSRDVRFEAATDVLAVADQHGTMPLPPYIDRSAEDTDLERYQTVFGDSPGSVAAPTASLHLTTPLLNQLKQLGVEIAKVDLAVGPGTFKPVQHENIDAHPMHAERCTCPPETVAAIEACRKRRGRVIAVGTTVVRTLETAAAAGKLKPYSGWTSIFLRPPYQPQVVDGLLTNFHLPRSTLLMLVACFTGLDGMHRCYQAAIEQQYRFYSYGDAMLILPNR